MAETTSTRGPRDDNDPKGLIREAYRIDGIDTFQCRSIFLDWALSLPDGMDPRKALGMLLDRYGAASNHPMTAILLDGLAAAPERRRRGGRAERAASRAVNG